MSIDPTLKNALNDIPLIDMRAALFKKGNFDFIVKGKDDTGSWKIHEVQKKALEVLTSNKYKEVLYGGAAGGAKSWTGCSWLLFMCINYPGTRWFVARNELKDIVDSVLVTWKKVCREYGFKNWKFNQVKNYIECGNGSFINFIELKYKPSDPQYEDIGSTEYTGGWCEEVSEQNETGVNVISTRAGRHMNAEYGLKATILMTTNPKRNWVKSRFYDQWKRGTLRDNLFYLPALVTDNPFIPSEYVENLRELSNKDKSLYERLFKGNWDYEDNPNALCDYEMIEMIFQNNHVPKDQTKYITADVARMGSDIARILVWDGWRVIEVQSFEVSKTTQISFAINLFRVKYQIPPNRVMIDSDGVGGGVMDEIPGSQGFINGGKPIKEDGDMPKYRNLQVQCLYHLAEQINKGLIFIDADKCGLSETEKEEIREELFQIQSKLGEDYTKLDCKPKSEIKVDIGRSPDWRDAILMRVYFKLRPLNVRVYSTEKSLAQLGVTW